MKKIFFALYVSMMIALSACAAPTPIIIVVTATPAPIPASPVLIATSTLAPIVALPTAANTATFIPTNTLTPIPPTLVNGLALPTLKSSPPDGQGFAMNDPIISGVTPATVYMSFRVKICYPDCKNKRDGDGIEKVNFYFCKANVNDNDCGANTAFYSHTENAAPYCSFGGGESNCNVIFFNDPKTVPNGFKIDDGDYKLRVEAFSNARNTSHQNTYWRGTVSYKIRR